MIAVFAMHSGLKKLKKVYKQVSAYVDLKKKNQKIFLALSALIASQPKTFLVFEFGGFIQPNSRLGLAGQCTGLGTTWGGTAVDYAFVQNELNFSLTNSSNGHQNRVSRPHLPIV